MTELSKTYRKSTRNTKIALALGGAAILTSGFLILQVNSLDRKYGRIEENLDFYTFELSSAQQQLELVRGQFRELSDQKQNLTEEVASAESSRQSASQREADAMARLGARQAELTSVQERLAEAERTISDAQRLERENTQLLTLRNDLQSQVSNFEEIVKGLEGRQQELVILTTQTETAVDRIEVRRDELQREVDSLGPNVEDLRAQERRVAQLQTDEARLVDRITALTASETDARNALAVSMEESNSATQRVTGIQQNLTIAQTSFDELTSDIDELKKQKSDLDVSVSGAEARLARLLNESEIAQTVLSRVEARRTGATLALSEAQEQSSILEAQLTTLRMEIARAEEGLIGATEQQTVFNRLQAEVERLQARKTELEESVPDLEGRVEMARSSFASTQADADAALGRLAQLTGSASSLETDIGRLEERRSLLLVAVEAAQVAADEAQAILQTRGSELTQVDARMQARSEELSRLDQRLLEERARLDALQEQIRAASAVLASEPDSAEVPRSSE